jgi:hypothetical protein
MQALLEHISALLQTKNAVQLAEPLPLIQQEQPILEESTSVWSCYFNSYAKSNSNRDN